MASGGGSERWGVGVIIGVISGMLHRLSASGNYDRGDRFAVYAYRASNLPTRTGCSYMETIEFLVQGSAPEPYQVKFARSGSNVTAFCSCPAGEMGTYCKHRFAILGGVADAVVSENFGQVSMIASWLPGSNLAERLAEIDAATREVERAKKAEAQAKKKLAAAMMGRDRGN